MGPNEVLRVARAFLIGMIALMAASVFSGCSEDGEQPAGYSDSIFYGVWKSVYVRSEGEWQYIRPTDFSDYGATFRFYTNGICLCDGPLTGDLSGTFEREGGLLTVYDQNGRATCRLTFHNVRYDIAEVTFEKIGLSSEIRMERTDHTQQDYVAVEGIELATSELVIDSTDPVRLEVRVLPQNATNKNVILKSRDERVVTVEEGKLVARSGRGRTVVEAITEEGGFSAECEVEVDMNLSMSASQLQIETGARSALTCILPDGSPYFGQVVWSSADPAIAEVRSEKGSESFVYGVSEGKTSVTARLEDDSDIECPITVVPTTKMAIRFREQRGVEVWGVVHSVLPDEMPYYLPVWSSSDESVLKVESSGDLCDSAKVFGVGPGTATLYAHSRDGKLSAAVEITIPELEVQDYIEFGKGGMVTTFEEYDEFELTYICENAIPSFYACSITPYEIALVSGSTGIFKVVAPTVDFREQELRSGEKMTGHFMRFTYGNSEAAKKAMQNFFYLVRYRDSRGGSHEQLFRFYE